MLAIYTRISQDRAEQVSISNQIDYGVALAEKLVIEYKTYEDKNISGTNDIKDRPSLVELIKDIQSGLITKVYVYDQSRLERNPEAYFILIRLFNDFNIELYYKDKLVTDDSSSKLIGSLMSVVNAHFVELSREKTKIALKSNAEKGKVHAIPPYGYRKDEYSKYAIDESTSQIVKEIYALSLNGVGMNKIAETLTNRGVPTKYNTYEGTLTTTNKNHKLNKKVTKSKKDIIWSGSTIRNIITNKFYAGVRIFSGIEYKVPVIVNLSYWEKVNNNLQKNRNNAGKSVTHKYLLKGLLSCGRCGRNYYGRTRLNLKDNAYICSSKRYKYLNCGNRGINITKLDEIIWNKFIVDGNLSKLIKQHFSSLNSNQIQIDINSEINDLKVSLKGLENKRDRIIDSIAEGLITNQEAKKKLNGIRIDIDTKESKCSALQEQLDHLIGSKNSLNDILEGLEFNPYDISLIDKREILGKYISDIVIYYDNESHFYIEIIFNIPFMDDVVFTVGRNFKIAYELLDLKKKEQDVIIMVLDNKLDREFKTNKEMDLNLLVNGIEAFEKIKKEHLIYRQFKNI